MLGIKLLMQLPDEMLSHLLLNSLSLKDLSSFDVAICNHTFRSKLWKIISKFSCLKPCSTFDEMFLSQPCLIWLFSRQFYVNSLKLENCQSFFVFQSDSLITDIGLSVILIANKSSLLCLDIRSCCNLAGLNISLSLFSNLLELNIIGCTGITYEAYISLSKVLTSLEILSLGYNVDSYITDAQPVINDNLLKTILPNFQKLISLKLWDRNVTGKGWIEIFPPNLTSLNCISCVNLTPDGLNDIFTNNSFNNIKYLSVTDCGEWVCLFLLTVLSHSNINVSNIISLDISDNDCSSFQVDNNNNILYFNSLTELNLSNYSISGDNIIVNILKLWKMPVLTKLKLDDKITMNGERFSRLIPSSLTYLSLCKCRKLSTDGLISIFANNILSNLTHLQMSSFGIDNLQEDFLPLFPRSLVSLSMVSIQKLTDHNLNLLLLNNLSNLEELTLSNCSYLIFEKIRPGIFQSNLTSINLNNNYNITSNGLSHIFSTNNLCNLTELHLTKVAHTPTLLDYITSRSNQYLKIHF
eukprot:gene6846-9373_t